MIKPKVYFDYINGEKKPLWIVVNIKESAVNLHQDKLSLRLKYPFEAFDFDEVSQNAINTSILISDLLISSYHQHEFAINLKVVKQRLDHAGVDYTLLENLVVRFEDVEEVLYSQVG